jgi:hypothetical protein
MDYDTRHGPNKTRAFASLVGLPKPRCSTDDKSSKIFFDSSCLSRSSLFLWDMDFQNEQEG